MPECYLKFHERMKGFKLRPDDIWIASFPKSGTTWTQVEIDYYHICGFILCMFVCTGKESSLQKDSKV